VAPSRALFDPAPLRGRSRMLALALALGSALAVSCSERRAENYAGAPQGAPALRKEARAHEPSLEEPPAADEGAKPVRDVSPASPSASASASASPPPGPRIYAKARFAWIQAAPRASPGWIGYLSFGGSVALRGESVEAARVGGAGCEAWYAVEPRGYVCAGDTATIDPTDPAVVALARDAPQVGSPWPYSYGESIGARRYVKIPTPAEQRAAEWDLEAHLKRVERARSGDGVAKDLVGVDLSPAGVPAPELFSFGPLVREARTFVVTGSTVAYTRAFDVDGRAFLLAHDKAILPKDRVRPYPRSAFQGTPLDGSLTLPIAFFRKAPRPKYKQSDDGTFQKTGETWPLRGFVALTGEEVKAKAQTFLATREPGIYALADDATVVRAATTAPSGKADPSAPGRRTWLDVSILGGWLVAYEGLTPVFATLISPGRGGIPFDGIDPLETASTPTGTFRIDGKFVAASMVSSTNDLLVHAEVPYVQNFHGPHAFHSAYWHDAWGEPKSGGCVNLAPIDAQRLFAWTEPEVPPGWHGVRSISTAGPATAVSIHR
jgi:hypothetical protein